MDPSSNLPPTNQPSNPASFISDQSQHQQTAAASVPQSHPSSAALHNPHNLTPESPQIQDLATRLYDAARAGDVATFSAALPAGLPPNMTNSSGDTLLMLATYHGHVALSKLLLSHGADPNRLNDRGQSPIAGAIFKEEDEVVECLLEAGADVDAGKPSAWECIGLFRKEDRWKEKFEKQRERTAEGKGSSAGQKTEGVGGTKEGVQMV